MKLEDLLGYSADQAEKLTKEQITELCKPFWNVTRPNPDAIKSMNAAAPRPKSNASVAKAKDLKEAMNLFKQFEHLIK